MPPRNAPSVSESPIRSVAHAVASATRRAKAVNTSSLRVLATNAKSGRTATRARPTATAKQAAALITARPIAGSTASPRPQAVATIRIRIAARSWKIRIAVPVSPTRAALLVALGDQASHDRGGGEGERRTHQQRRRRPQPDQQADPAEADRAERDLHRAEAEDVARLLAHVAEAEMQAHIEQEEDDAEFGQRLHRTRVQQRAEP